MKKLQGRIPLIEGDSAAYTVEAWERLKTQGDVPFKIVKPLNKEVMRPGATYVRDGLGRNYRIEYRTQGGVENGQRFVNVVLLK